MAYITSFQVELLSRVVLAAVCGACIGYERRNHYKPAGVKTHMIVGFSSALIMIVSKYGFDDSNNFDAARVAAQVVSGIGFIGAGIIFKKDMSVQGLTTAAGILGTSGVGLSLGSGMYTIGILGTAIYMILCQLVQNIDKFQNGIQDSYNLYFDSSISMNEAINFCKNIKIVAYSIALLDKNQVRLEVSLVFDNKKQEQSWEEYIMSSRKVYKIEKY